MTINNRNQLLSLGIPALSGPVGSREIATIADQTRQRDMSNITRPNDWGRDHSDYGKGWLHSDIINMAFFYNCKFFEDIVDKGGLK